MQMWKWEIFSSLSSTSSQYVDCRVSFGSTSAHGAEAAFYSSMACSTAQSVDITVGLPYPISTRAWHTYWERSAYCRCANVRNVHPQQDTTHETLRSNEHCFFCSYKLDSCVAWHPRRDYLTGDQESQGWKRKTKCLYELSLTSWESNIFLSRGFLHPNRLTVRLQHPQIIICAFIEWLLCCGPRVWNSSSIQRKKKINLRMKNTKKRQYPNLVLGISVPRVSEYFQQDRHTLQVIRIT